MLQRSQSGVALAIVVWFLAAMSLLVAGIVLQAKVDTRMAQTHIARAKAVAAGDGAIQLMLAALETNQIKGYRGRGVPRLDFQLGDQQVNVSLVPVAGLIDVNGAPRELLVALFSSVIAAPGDNAQLLADKVIEWRKKISTKTRQAVKFASIEDLMQVEGMTRTIFEQIRDSVAVGSGALSGVDWMSAPPSVLVVLAGKNTEMVSAILSSREGRYSTGQVIPRGLNPRYQAVGAGNDYRVDASIIVGDKQWLRRRWVSLDSRGSQSLLPWHFTRTEAARAVNVVSVEK